MHKSDKSSFLNRVLLAFVGISGAFSVLFGAWLAHGGQALSVEDFSRLTNAHQYQFLHTIALLTVVLMNIKQRDAVLTFSASCFAMGILLFSGSLYVKTFYAFAEANKLAPVGGISLTLAWLALAVFSVFKIGKENL